MNDGTSDHGWDELALHYEPPPVGEIDPSFIYLSPTVMERSDFEATDSYEEPVEPRVQTFDFAQPRRETQASAAEFVTDISNRLNRLNDVYDKIFEIISAKRYRAGTMKQTQFEENRELFRPLLQAQIEAGEPLQFVLPSFPYKFANPVKVTGKSPDMAEVLCLSQLYEICLALGQVYEPGVRFIIISDGQLYQSMFGISVYEAINYREQVEQMIVNLGYDDHIDLVDMVDLISQHQSSFDQIKGKLRPVFDQWWEANPQNERRASLIKSSASNINSAGEITNDLVQLATKDITHATDEDEALTNFKKVRASVSERSQDAAFEFALVLYTLRELDLVARCYSEAVRATVHPKPKQWGLHLVNQTTRVFPWQGVAHRAVNGRWTVKYEFEVLRRRAVPVHLEGMMFPFYYEEASS